MHSGGSSLGGGLIGLEQAGSGGVSDLWNEAGLPELTTPGEVGPLSLSPRHVESSSQTTFFVGQLLADIHSQGLRYADLHRGNYGMSRSGGGLRIIDYGGYVECTLDAQDMAGDFVVPLLDFTEHEIQAFVCGYVERSHVIIDPRHPGFTDQVLASIGIRGDRITADPRVDQEVGFRDTGEWTDAVGFAAVCLIICSDANPARQEAFLAGFLDIEDADAWPEASPLAELVALAAFDEPSSELIRELAADRTVGPFPHASMKVDSTAAIRPSARAAGQILAALDRNDQNNALLREAFTEVCFLLASEACSSDSADGNAAAIALLTLGFSVAADHSANVARYERLHYWMWHRMQSMPVSGALSLARAEAKDIYSALGIALFFLRAGLFDMEYFGASLSAAQKNDESLCGYAIVSAVNLFRRAVMALSIWAIPAARHSDTLASFQEVARGVFSGYLHAARLVATAASNLQDATAAFQLWGTQAETLVECAEWLQHCKDRLAASDLRESDLLEIFQDGKKHYILKDFRLETPFDTI